MFHPIPPPKTGILSRCKLPRPGRVYCLMHRTFAALLVLCAVPLLARTEESSKNWSEDLAVFQRELPRTHKNLFHSMTREDFDAAVAHVAARLPARDDDWTCSQLWR